MFSLVHRFSSSAGTFKPSTVGVTTDSRIRNALVVVNSIIRPTPPSSFYPIDVTLSTRDSEHPRHLSHVDVNPLAGSTRVRGLADGDCFRLLCSLAN